MSFKHNAVRRRTPRTSTRVTSWPAHEAGLQQRGDLTLWLDAAAPGVSEFYDKPQGTMRFATHLFRTGVLKTEPRSWKDYVLPVAHDLAGI